MAKRASKTALQSAVSSSSDLEKVSKVIQGLLMADGKYASAIFCTWGVTGFVPDVTTHLLQNGALLQRLRCNTQIP